MKLQVQITELIFIEKKHLITKKEILSWLLYFKTKIYRKDLLFRFNFGNLCAIESNRVLCYYLVHTFKIKKIQIDSSNRIPRFEEVVKNFGFFLASLRAIFVKFWRNRMKFLSLFPCLGIRLMKSIRVSFTLKLWTRNVH